MKEKEKNESFHYSSAFMPQEELLETGRTKKKLSVGILAEDVNLEKRVALTPEACGLLTITGNELMVQTGAGRGANYSDRDYSENGVQIAKTAGEVLKCDVLVKVTPFKKSEIESLNNKQVVMSYLNILKQNEADLKIMIKRGVSAIAYENIMDSNNEHPVVESMSEISGITSILIASEYLSNLHGGKGVMLGGISGVTPTEVIILGAGTAGEYAARAALGLGSVVKIFDKSLHDLRKFQSIIGQRLQTSVYHPQVLKKALKSADVVIGAIDVKESIPWYYITEDMVMTMKKGSVIIDLAIDRGGCFETTECRELKDSVYEKHGVIHFSAWNLPSRVARTASIALSNVLTPLIQDLSDNGGLDAMLKRSQGLSEGVYVYRGILTSQVLGQKFGILSKDINLLLAAF